jgi:AcrR family transcriptional regulator
VSTLLREDQPRAGLRERKKAKTRSAIQHEALRLFREHGYDETTIDQIAEAAEVSPSTFFRYFGTKEEVVLTDDYDPAIVEAFRDQPIDLSPIAAMRSTLRAVFSEVGDDELVDMRMRMELTLTVPALRAAMMNQFVQTIGEVTELVAERVGRPADDFSVRTLAGATLGVMIAAELQWAEHPDLHLLALLDEALANLESGLVLR